MAKKGSTPPLIIVTGLSGAGKSQALKVLEDFSYFCVDNLPTVLVAQFLDTLERSSMTRFNKVALGIDIRTHAFLEWMPQMLEILRQRGRECKILFLDAKEDILLRRFSETRHKHPFSGKSLIEAIRSEKKQMQPLKEVAHQVIDTTDLTLGELKEAVSIFLGVSHESEMHLAVVSFGFKYGLPGDADLVWDVRFLPNQNYIAALKPLDGLDAKVSRYVFAQPKAAPFAKNLLKMLRDLLPYYIHEGKSYLTVGIGCTGGRHRSVAIAHNLSDMLRDAGYTIREFHRDVHKT